MLEGEMIFELEGEPERVIRAGEAFWEPGGDVIHYQAANNLADRWSRFVVVMLCAPEQEMLVFVDDDELFDADGVRRAVALAAPDVVMHQLTDLKGGNRQANSEMRVTGTRHLVDAALAVGVRRVVAQSIAWAYEAGPVPATEDVRLDLGSSGSRLRTVQGVASLEAAVREAPEWVVLRYGLLYGPGTWYARGGLMADAAARGELAADGDVSSFVHVDDAAGAAADALTWPAGFVNVCDDVPAPGREWVPAFCRAVGVVAEPVISGGERQG
jgi:nucleoside-diphosphate-sugar epimerase